uniref:Uncharacterized protein n=1 Tax=Anopheles maculatus TaxID=74869 RepID=A0A182SJ01_9DIPT
MPPDEVVLALNDASADGTAADGTVAMPAPSSHACQLDIAGATGSRREDGPPVVEVEERKPSSSFRCKYRKRPPIYLGPDRRQFANPISYLGGPRYDLTKRGSVASSQGDSVTSLNSIMSLD